jgi:hypothetical protein
MRSLDPESPSGRLNRLQGKLRSSLAPDQCAQRGPGRGVGFRPPLTAPQQLGNSTDGPSLMPMRLVHGGLRPIREEMMTVLKFDTSRPAALFRLAG